MAKKTTKSKVRKTTAQKQLKAAAKTRPTTKKKKVSASSASPKATRTTTKSKKAAEVIKKAALPKTKQAKTQTGLSVSAAAIAQRIRKPIKRSPHFMKVFKKLERMAGDKNASITFGDLNESLPKSMIRPEIIDEMIVALSENKINVMDGGVVVPLPKMPAPKTETMILTRLQRLKALT